MQIKLATSFFIFFFLIIAGLDCKKPKPTDNNDPPVYTYEWMIDTLVFDIPGVPPPDQVSVQCIWGSSPHDVWAVATSDIPQGELWHYNGMKWKAVRDWPFSGIDSGGSYINDVSSVTGFDSTNVFVFGGHGYDTTGRNIVLKWNGHTWSIVPWKSGKAPRGALGWGVKQNNNKLWAVSVTGEIIKYENGELSVEPQFTNYRLTGRVIAALDNGEVYVNPYKDSLIGDTLLMGSITKLYKRDLSGTWSLLEDKYIDGAWEDGNGLGHGVFSIGNSLFTGNLGLWERVNTSWVKRLDIYAIGGECMVSEKDIWIYFKHELWHWDGKEWKFFTISLLGLFPEFALFNRGWSDGNEVFITFHNGSKTYILHGKKKKV
jgi:hypothetical protein